MPASVSNPFPLYTGLGLGWVSVICNQKPLLMHGPTEGTDLIDVFPLIKPKLFVFDRQVK